MAPAVSLCVPCLPAATVAEFGSDRESVTAALADAFGLPAGGPVELFRLVHLAPGEVVPDDGVVVAQMPGMFDCESIEDWLMQKQQWEEAQQINEAAMSALLSELSQATAALLNAGIAAPSSTDSCFLRDVKSVQLDPSLQSTPDVRRSASAEPFFSETQMGDAAAEPQLQPSECNGSVFHDRDEPALELRHIGGSPFRSPHDRQAWHDLRPGERASAGTPPPDVHRSQLGHVRSQSDGLKRQLFSQRQQLARQQMYSQEARETVELLRQEFKLLVQELLPQGDRTERYSEEATPWQAAVSTPTIPVDSHPGHWSIGVDRGMRTGNMH
mmetsp:Transcript_47972/g.104276  ORF Transcript_47972/g.104276 Transcript_47972/m.104276 type:complete len:328 (+) Transcript_47972:50-1033(+)